MGRLPLAVWLLAASNVSCLGLNGQFDEAQTEGNSDGGGGVGPTGSSSASSNNSASGTGTSTSTSSVAASSSTTTSSGAETQGTPALVEFTDDAWEGEFAEAEDLGPLGWVAGSVQLPANSDEGVLESRIFDAGRETTWVELRWSPRGPYQTQLELPRDDIEATYPTGNTSVESLEFLGHLEDGPFLDGDVVHDATEVRHGRWTGAPTGAAALEIEGVFGSGLHHDDDNGTDAFRIDLPNPVEPGLGPFTWTVWYRSESCAGLYMFALDSADVDPTNTGLYFMGCGGTGAYCPDDDPSHAVGFLRAPGQPSPLRVCSDVSIDDGRWHHLALRREVIGTGQNLRLFVDGRMAGQTPALVAGITDVSVHLGAPEPEDFTLAGGNAEPYSGAGDYDEFAMWNRALSTEELEAMYRRGALVARFQLRACHEPDCGDQDFEGPEGKDIEAGYVDSGLQADHAIDLSALGLYGRYIQYRFLLRRPESELSPAIEAVTVTGIRD